MGLMTAAAATREISAELEADIAKFDRMLGEYLAGRLEEDEFRIFRLNNGIYGQRQGGHHQMVRVKAPYGSITPEQLEMLADIADRYSRGWGHLTTRQNIQFHFVELERVPALLRDLARVGMTTREACGDTVRNITGCHLAGACPFEVLDITPWAEAAFRHFLHHPYAQRLPRKFKINFSGCVTDCGQAMFNDVGVVAVSRPLPDGGTEAGVPGVCGRGPGRQPPSRPGARGVHTRVSCCWPLSRPSCGPSTTTATATTSCGPGSSGWSTPWGSTSCASGSLKERRLLVASSTWPGGIPAVVQELGDAPAGVATGLSPTPVGTPVTLRLGPGDPYKRWEAANVVIGVAKGTVSAIAYARLGDITSSQFRELAAIQRELGATVRITNRQNLAFRDLSAEQLPELYGRLDAIGMAEPGAELARDVVSCPGADTCNLAVTQSRGLADDIGKALEKAGLGRRRWRAHQHLGLHQQLWAAPCCGHRV